MEEPLALGPELNHEERQESFSSQVKAELCKDKLSHSCCALAEAYGVLLFCNTFLNREIRIVTGSAAVAQRLPRLFRRAFGLKFDQQPLDLLPGAKYTFLIQDRAKLETILSAYGYAPQQMLSHHVNYAVLEEPCCQASFFRGAFLAGGSAIDPHKHFHLEFTTSHYYVARELRPLMAELGMEARTVVRNANYVNYFKRGETVADFLTAIGAPVSAMDVMNMMLEKNIRNKVNRRYNCDVANVEKAVAAAQTHIGAIHQLRRTGKWESLPENLKQTAQLREENPELSLSQLAQVAGISKSCLNHRLRRLLELGSGS